MQQPSIGYGGGSTDTISNLAQQAATQLGWNPTFVLKQWALETGNFTSRLYKNDNNIAGIKWYPGMTYGTKGSAAPDGGNYAHFSDPVTGYVNFVKNNPRYSNVKNSQDVYTEAKTIAADGWATDPNYASKIMGMKVDGSLAVDTSSSGSGSNSDSGSSAPSFGLSDIPNLISKSLGVLVGAGIVFLGIYIAMNPLGDLTTAIASAAKEFSKMPFEGATKAVKNAPNNFRKRKNENIKKNNEISGKRNEIASKRKEEKAIDKQMKLLDKHLAKLEKKKMG